MTTKLKQLSKIFILILVVAVITGKASTVPELTTWLRVALDTVSSLAYLSLVGIALVAFYQWAIDFLKVEPVKGVNEAPAINHAVSNLERVLTDLGQDTSRATVLIADADIQASMLVRLIKAIALKTEQMRLDATGLGNALIAIETGDPVKIATAAGSLSDAHLRELMLCSVKTQTYWLGVSNTLAAQLGTITQWTRKYEVFIEQLLTDTANAKAQMAALTASKQLAIVAEPLLTIQANITDAHTALQLQRRVYLGEAAGYLPTVNAGLLQG